MGAPKYKDLFKKPSQDEEEIDEIKQKILSLFEKEEDLDKLAKIISKLINDETAD